MREKEKKTLELKKKKMREPLKRNKGNPHLTNKHCIEGNSKPLFFNSSIPVFKKPKRG